MPIRICSVFLDHVQHLQIHAVRANFLIMISVRSGYTFGHAVKSTQISHLWPVCLYYSTAHSYRKGALSDPAERHDGKKGNHIPSTVQ